MLSLPLNLVSTEIWSIGLMGLGCLISLLASASKNESDFFKRTCLANFLFFLSFYMRENYFAAYVSFVCAFSTCAFYIKNVKIKIVFLATTLLSTLVYQYYNSSPPYAVAGLLLDFSVLFMSSLLRIRLVAFAGCLFWAMFSSHEGDYFLLFLTVSEAGVLFYKILEHQSTLYFSNFSSIRPYTANALMHIIRFIYKMPLLTSKIVFDVDLRWFDQRDGLKLRPGWSY